MFVDLFKQSDVVASQFGLKPVNFIQPDADGFGHFYQNVFDLAVPHPK